jgi:hypothetical protein
MAGSRLKYLKCFAIVCTGCAWMDIEEVDDEAGVLRVDLAAISIAVATIAIFVPE